MKNFILSLVLVFVTPYLLGAQMADSATVKRGVDSLITLSREFTRKSDFEQALAVNEVAENLAVKTFGSASAIFGNCCFNRGRIFYFKGDYPESEKWYLESKHILEKNLGKEHPDYAKCLNNLAALYNEMGNFRKAEILHLETISIREKTLGKEHPDYAKSINNLAIIYHQKGSYTKAEPLFLEAKDIWGKTLGKDHPDYAISLNNLAVLYGNMGNFEKAEPFYLETKSIRENVLGKEHPDYAETLDNLAILYSKMGNFEKAGMLHLEAKSTREKTLGKEHPDYAISLNNLAVVHVDIGEYEKAETLHLEAKSIREKTLGKEHPDYAATLHNLAVVYLDMGDLERAKALFIEALSIREKIFGRVHSDYASSLYNLGAVYGLMGNHEKAEPLLLEANAIWEKTFGSEHPYYAKSLVNIAAFYQATGDLKKAEPCYLKAITILEKVLGRNHLDYAESLISLGDFYFKMRTYENAKPFYLEANDIFIQSFGKGNPKYAKSLNKLALLALETGDYENAGISFQELSNIHQKLVARAFQHFTEHELKSYLNRFSDSQNQILTFLTSNEHRKLVASCYENAVFYKGIRLSASTQIRQLTLTDSAATGQYNLLKSCLRSLATEYAKPIAERDSARIAEWEENANAIEKELVRTVAGYGDLVRQVSWEEVKQQLRPGEAAVELVSYNYYTPEPTDSTLYAALVLLPTDTAPHFIPLFEERQLQALLHRPELGEELTVKGLYASNSELLNLLWTPLEPLLRDVKTVYYSPAGLLHRVNPAALRDADKQPLSAGRAWVRVGSTRELVTGRLADRSYALEPNASATAAVWGGIRYDMDSTAFAAANPLDPAAGPLPEFERKDGKFRYMVEEGSPALSTRLRGAGDAGWSPLTGSAREAEQVDSLLQKAGFRTEVFSNYSASEERFKALGQASSSPRILHVATHGFSYPDPKKEPQRGFAGEEPVYKLQDDPMLRSGLLLAGANHYWKNKRPLQDREDGVLVAYEVRDLNLRNTELAVLSACQTGLGDVVGSEGVYGLQRAFRIAGAKFLIVSLWQVPDEQTRELMRLFYENWVDKRESLRDAFNHAQATLREQEPNPYMWAGFVLIE